MDGGETDRDGGETDRDGGETDRETARETGRQTHSKTDRQGDRQRHVFSQTNTQAYIVNHRHKWHKHSIKSLSHEQ